MLPSAWVQRFMPLIAPGAAVLDLACGSGRHVAWLLAQGYRVTGVDRDAAALAQAAASAASAVNAADRLELITADIEAGPWPLAGRRFGAIVITNYLWRPLWPALLAALHEGGVLLVETFAHGHGSIGRPARPDFLLQPGELLQVAQGLRVVAFEDGFEAASATHGARFVQRIAAVRPVAEAPEPPPRYRLDGLSAESPAG
jgi:SAM-dependent methyltransferase